MKKQRILCLCMASLLALSLSACNGQADEDSTPAPSAQATSTPSPTLAPTPTPEPFFTDVPEDTYYHDAVKWALDNEITALGSDNLFNPSSACTRGQVITFMWRAAGSPEPQATESPFSDISPEDWFYQGALWASEQGLTTGTVFNPSNPCTTGEVITFLWRAEGKPAAAVYSSPMALAASGAYYERPVAWAENSGMFAGLDSTFDPSAPCTRAGLMSYLYCTAEGWTFTEEDKTVQAEYEQIINDAQLYEVHGSGLVYADYVDVDNDGNVELLTLDISKYDGDYSYYYDMGTVTATIYANIGGHAGKSCEVELPFGVEMSYSICKAEDNLYLCFCSLSNSGTIYAFDKIDNEAFVRESDLYVERQAQTYNYFNFDHEITEDEYNTFLQKYTVEKELLSTDFGYSTVDVSIQERGLLLSADEYWHNYWMSQPMYAAVLNGDFSAFAGTYECAGGIAGWLVLDNNGTLTGDVSAHISNLKPSSITVAADGKICCVLITGDGTNGLYEESYVICPIGVGGGSYYDVQLGEEFSIDTSKIRIEYNWGTTYYKVS